MLEKIIFTRKGQIIEALIDPGSHQNSNMQNTTSTRKEINLSLEEVLDGETSRAAVAESCVQSLLNEFMANTEFSIESVVGEGPETDDKEWIKRLEAVQA